VLTLNRTLQSARVAELGHRCHVVTRPSLSSIGPGQTESSQIAVFWLAENGHTCCRGF